MVTLAYTGAGGKGLERPTGAVKPAQGLGGWWLPKDF